ncbi:GTP pyrophosphokinase [Mycetocola reblochoni]|uniref:GTP pyrophosphokinase n=2 Tax=Mycetocola reblochoni TaxID=331618 RepID=A0A1R4I8Y4_9MICO|nr:GTP pyrophosphokinase family protein [Mycetocola reblochoni]RLP68949.1 GTP pyrophosphokinase family protein [Mycetocola reblochoni]SJN16064.1 GTP pyrophosphokinase [Mycetocola reblochoni REB411]
MSLDTPARHRAETDSAEDTGARLDRSELAAMRTEMTRMMMAYKFGLDEVMTKVNILKEEFAHIHDYNPIEHVSSRLKSPASIIAKAERLGVARDVDSIRGALHDIAGVRIVCSFIPDIASIQQMLARQRDVRVLEVKDYITSPKPNGYRSLHMILETPVHLSDRVENVVVEVQLRTSAMDFWASLEHKINYKFDGSVPDNLIAELTAAAESANDLDLKMQSLHQQIESLRDEDAEPSEWAAWGRLPLSTEILRAVRNLSDGPGADSRTA